MEDYVPFHNKKEPEVENKAFLPYPIKTSDPPFSLVDRAKEIEQADLWIKTSVNQKLDLILKQIQALQNQAREILIKAQEDAKLHRVSCNFEKKPGMILHLYEKENGELYFSLLSPEEWGSPPHQFIASYRLLHDMSFEKITENS
ncbi:MAG: DUF2452 domain-containing protein [Leptospiraceae bacterium]|nr:DUF2452 domain-containing protein [Leptospiraceae bacterium]MDW7975649.1 DUF2452 domain-containing protein [Leptospiraceae bacterium]